MKRFLRTLNLHFHIHLGLLANAQRHRHLLYMQLFMHILKSYSLKHEFLPLNNKRRQSHRTEESE